MSGKMTVGSRAQVWHGTAKHTSGGLTKTHLMMNKAGRIVSRKKHASAKKDNRLVKAGYKTKKGHFGFVKDGSRKRGSRKHGRKGHRGGASLASQAWEEVGAAGASPETRALMSGGAIYGADVLGSNLSGSNGSGSGSGSMSGDGIAGAGITNFGQGSIGAQIRAGMAGGRRRRRGMRGGTTSEIPFDPNDPQQMAMNAVGGRRRKHRGGTDSVGYLSGPQLTTLSH